MQCLQNPGTISETQVHLYPHNTETMHGTWDKMVPLKTYGTDHIPFLEKTAKFTNEGNEADNEISSI